MTQSINIEDELKILKASFPIYLENEVENLLSLININSEHSAHRGYVMNQNGSLIEIPSRVYWDEHRLMEPRGLTKTQRTILNCILTRHHNGYVREKYLTQLISSNEYWTTPFLVQLLGEYVVELLEMIWKNFDSINLDNLLNFIRENEQYWFQTKQRIASYWDCYYRHKNPKQDYVGYKLINRIEELIKVKTIPNKS